MMRPHLRYIPAYSLPSGYSFRTYQPGDDGSWAQIEHSAGEFKNIDAAHQHFSDEFGNQIPEMKYRCIFLLHKDVPVGTATAWYGQFQHNLCGRLHWVAIIPRFQGKNLAKPLVARALSTMAAHHTKAYLTSQTTSFKAVKIYLDFGFRPVKTNEESERAWTILADTLRHPALPS